MDFAILQERLPCSTVIVTIAIALLIAVIYFYSKYSDILPGPTGLPYIGLFPRLQDETCHLQFVKYAKKYGDVFSFTHCGKLFIHMGSVKATRDLHINKSDCFGGRYTSFNVLTEMLPNSVAMANGEIWKTHRKFFNQKFREYGLNSLKDQLAGPIYDSMEATIKSLKDTQDKSVNIMELLSERCAFTLRRIVFGENGISDEDLRTLNQKYAASMEGMMGKNMLIMGPLGRFLFSIMPSARKAFKEHEGVREIMKACIKRVEASMDEGHPTCIIEEYFKERNEKRRQNDPIWKLYTDEALVSSLSQFVGDGVSGVAAFISCFFNALIEHPDEQEKIYEEIIEVVGTTRQPTLDDKAKLTYTNAFLNEYIRLATFIAFFPSLECTKETTYKGYRIPKGAITVYNFWAIHRNPETYDDPETFNPSRYLPAPGKPRAELPLTFGIGKRACAGEGFVMAQSFLYVITLVRNFKVVSSNDSKNSFANFLLSGQLELRFQPRDEK